MFSGTQEETAVKSLLKWAVLTAVVWAFTLTPAQAWWGRRRAAHADRNRDGVVTPAEVHKEKQWEHKQAARVNTPWERLADADGDGRVEPAEYRAHHLRVVDLNRDGSITIVERRTYWTGWKGIVNTEVERRYDANGDGYLEWPEARALLQDRMRVINTDGRAIVDTDIEREFDENCDGVIDRKEAEAIREALE
jgi:hypothetical protein